MTSARRDLISLAALVLLGASAVPAFAQAAAPEAPAAPPAAQLPPMPPPNPADFTATAPTKETVQQFLKASWGYDPNRIWQVQAIQTTPVEGLSKVTVLVEEKNAPQPQQQASALVFLTLPDGKHLIANDDVLPFGPHPFEANNALLSRDAKGPSRGPAQSKLLLVEFADFECPHCKEAQPTVERLLKDYPQARFVSEPFPLREIHSEAERAAEAGVCVAKLAGNDAYFKYADAVYAAQSSLTPQGSAQAIQGAVTAAGADPAKVQACVAQPATKAAVDEALHLGNQVGVNSTPTLFVNGRNLPFGGIPYETLKQIIDYDLKQAGGAQ